MGTRRWTTWTGLVLASIPPAQQLEVRPAAPRPTTTILRTPDLARFDEAAPPERAKAIDRLIEVLRNTPMGDARSLSLQKHDSTTGPVVLVRGTAEQRDVVKSALAQIGRTDLGTARLHCSVVTMPLQVAAAHKLQPGRTVVTDEATWSELLRDAVKAKGSVHNLPEITAGMLEPFERSATSTKVTPDSELPRLRGEVVPLDDKEIAVAFELTRKAKQGNQPTTIARPVFRLEAGKAAMMAAVDGDRVVVLIARCIEAGIPGK